MTLSTKSSVSCRNPCRNVSSNVREYGSAGLTVERRQALLCDADALRELHIWTRSRPERARAAMGARVGTLAG